MAKPLERGRGCFETLLDKIILWSNCIGWESNPGILAFYTLSVAYHWFLALFEFLASGNPLVPGALMD